MKIIRRIFVTIIILTTVGLLFRGWFYRNLVTYKSVGHRNISLVTEKDLEEYLEESINKQTGHDVEQIIKLGLSITSKQLHFTVNKNEIDPNKLLYTKRAHCVGYASFFATTCNYLFKKFKFSDNWIVKQQIGQLYFLGINIHNYFNSSFFKDHDFVTIENKTTGEIYAVDPTVNDYLCIDFITYTK